MRRFNVALLTFVVCHMVLIDQSEAMYGLCSTDWFGWKHCFDFNDECSQEGGKCYYHGDGDKGEGCVCKKKIRQTHPGAPRYITLHKSHLRK